MPCFHDWLIHRRERGSASWLYDGWGLEAKRVLNFGYWIVGGLLVFLGLAGLLIPSTADWKHPVVGVLGITTAIAVMLQLLMVIEKPDVEFYDRTCRKCGKAEFQATELEMKGKKIIEDRESRDARLCSDYRRNVELFKKAG